MNLNILKGLNKNTNQNTGVQQPIQPEPQVVQQPIQPEPQVVQQPIQPEPQVVQQPIQPESNPQVNVEPNVAQQPFAQQPFVQQAYGQQPYSQPIVQPQPQPAPQKEGYILVGYDANLQPIYNKDNNYNPSRKLVGYDANMQPIYETPKKDIVITQPLSMITKELTQEELSQHIIESLSLKTNDVTVFEVPHANVKPKVLDVKDTRGIIAQKLEKVEQDTGLSVIPFKMAGITKFVTEIMGYEVFEIDGEKYASSTQHRVSPQRVDTICNLIDNTIISGGVVNEKVMMEYSEKGVTYNVCQFNKYEMGYLEALYRNYRAVFYSIGPDVYIAVGA